MRTAARLFPLFFCGLLLAAHFLRWGHPLASMLCLFFPAIVFFRRPWARLAAWAYCAFGALVWATAANGFVTERMLAERPWARMLAILGTVAALNLLAGALLCGARMRAWFGVPETPSA